MIRKVQHIGVSQQSIGPKLGIARQVATTTESGADISGGSAVAENIGPERRRQMIAEAAYFRAQRRGFAPGAEVEDWLESEAEIEELLAAG